MVCAMSECAREGRADRLGALLLAFFVLFQCGLDELSEFFVFSAFFKVGQFIILRFFHQLQIALVPIQAQ
jgi:hypothetical protein